MRQAIGHDFELAQVNFSTSKSGVIRGIHFAAVPPSQAKYVMCTSGSIYDVTVDLRIGSPTFGRWEAVQLDATNRAALYVAEGPATRFMALEPSTVIYLCNQTYNPGREFEVHPFDPAIGIDWPDVGPVSLSDKDAAASGPRGGGNRLASCLPTSCALNIKHRSTRASLRGISLRTPRSAGSSPTRDLPLKTAAHLSANRMLFSSTFFMYLVLEELLRRAILVMNDVDRTWYVRSLRSWTHAVVDVHDVRPLIPIVERTHHVDCFAPDENAAERLPNPTYGLRRSARRIVIAPADVFDLSVFGFACQRTVPQRHRLWSVREDQVTADDSRIGELVPIRDEVVVPGVRCVPGIGAMSG